MQCAGRGDEPVRAKGATGRGNGNDHSGRNGSCRVGCAGVEQPVARDLAGVAAGHRAGQIDGDVAGVEQLVEVDAGLDPHTLEQVDHVFGGDVAGGAGRERAAAEAADRAVERTDSGIHGGQYIGDAEASGVMTVESEGRLPAECLDRLGGEALDVRRNGHAGGVAQGQFEAVAQRHDALDGAEHGGLVHDAGERAVERGRKPDAGLELALRVDLGEGRLEIVDGPGRPAHVAHVVRVRHRDHELDVLDAGGERAFGALRVRHQRHAAHAGVAPAA